MDRSRAWPVACRSYMNSSVLQLSLSPSPEQAERLAALQARFAEACNWLMPTVRETQSWHRVSLHHATYQGLRAAFPDLGSQMACNAIYSVSRTCRLAFQTPGSPFFRARRTTAPLPEIRFLPSSPVFFDRHTISVRDGQLSMFTLGGRMRFLGALTPAEEARFAGEKLREIVLVRRGEGFQLNFLFGGAPEAEEAGEVQGERPQFQVLRAEAAGEALCVSGPGG